MLDRHEDFLRCLDLYRNSDNDNLAYLAEKIHPIFAAVAATLKEHEIDGFINVWLTKFEELVH